MSKNEEQNAMRDGAPSLFPMFLKLEGRSCLVVGAGSVGEPKIRSLLQSGAKVRVVAPRASAAVAEWAESGAISWQARDFELTDLPDAFLVIAATSSRDLNEIIFREAHRVGILCNSVDDPERCDFFYPAVVRRGDLQIAISTAGHSPALAQRLRRELEAQYGPEYSEWVAGLGAKRQRLFAGEMDPEERRQKLHELASAESFASASAQRESAGKGKVFLVGAGPGDPELLSVKALRALESADIVLHDELVSAAILALIPHTSQIRNVGKRCGQKGPNQEDINALMVEHAALGQRVVRLKIGDPMIYGRVGEEIEALREANIEFEVVPGITAAVAAASAVQIPLTHRHLSSTLIVLTGHQAETGGPGAWPEQLPVNATVVIYMPGHHYEATTRRLLAAGLPREMPCAIISRTGCDGEQVFCTSLEALPKALRLPAPAVLVVGEVVRFASHASLREQFAWPAERHELISLPAHSAFEESK